MHVGDQAVQEQNGANINPRANVRRLELFCPRTDTRSRTSVADTSSPRPP